MIQLATVAAPPSISVDELRTLLEEGDPPLIVDVRARVEREEWAIPGSISVDVYAALNSGDPRAMTGVDVPADRPVVTVCGAGKTSLIAAAQLRDRGIQAVSLAGGMKAWSLAWNLAEVPLATSRARVMQLRRTGKGCLSYLVGSHGEAAVIDPSLAPEIYRDLAGRLGLSITHVLETHIHADHLMRSRALAAQTGARLLLPATDRLAFSAGPLNEGDIVEIGRSRLWTLATPGHTQESLSFLLDGEALFTGDTLFLAAVGRPDLEASPGEARARAHLLHASLDRLSSLPPRTIVLPGHTDRPVAFDRRPLAATLGEVREQIPILRLAAAEFVDTILARIPPTPPNHAAIVAFNEAGEWPDGDPTDLEAGANRCAVA